MNDQDTIELRIETEPERELRAVEVLRANLPVLRGALLREKTRSDSSAAARKVLEDAIDRSEGVLFRRARRDRQTDPVAVATAKGGNL